MCNFPKTLKYTRPILDKNTTQRKKDYQKGQVMPEEHTNKQKVDQSVSFSLTEVKIQVMGNTQECVELVNLMKQRKYLYTYLNDCIRLRKIRLLPQTFCRFTRKNFAFRKIW
jgi:hypothetical protein